MSSEELRTSFSDFVVSSLTRKKGQTNSSGDSSPEGDLQVTWRAPSDDESPEELVWPSFRVDELTTKSEKLVLSSSEDIMHLQTLK